jgi:hypothetical protein
MIGKSVFRDLYIDMKSGDRVALSVWVYWVLVHYLVVIFSNGEVGN